jgi:excisionase family DNA binding protein
MDDPRYSVAKLARRWDCSEGLIYKLISNGTLKCFRPGTLIRIRASEVERYEREMTERPRA